MGYRSDVIALIYPEPQPPDSLGEQELYEQLKLLMATQFKDVVEMGFVENMTWHDSTRVLKFDIQSVKWYDSYSDVQAFMGMLSVFKGYDDADIKGYCTEFVRIGEDDDDVETERTGENGHYYLQVRRSIDCDV